MSDVEKDIVERLIDALRASAVRTQQAWQMMADDKSARNRAAGDVGASYDGGTKEQTLEWRAADTITTLRAQNERLTALTAGWVLHDEALPEDEAIATAHPLKSGDHDGYMEAMRLVGAKRSKGALVDLVHWLLTFKARADKAEREVATLRAEVDRLTSELDGERQEIKTLRVWRDAAIARAEKAEHDTKRLDALQNESWDLRCFSMPTAGGDDADIGWRVVGHWMAEPCERIVGEAYTDDLRVAVDNAISRASLTEEN